MVSLFSSAKSSWRQLNFLIGSVVLICLGSSDAFAQEVTRDEELRGVLTPLRTCYDVREYHLDVRIDPATKSIKGSNQIVFDAVATFDRMQVELFSNLAIDGIRMADGEPAKYTREENSVFIELPKEIEKGADTSITIEYSGSPIVAKRPPWSGGFTWAEDKDGNPWVVVTCQGTGASLWWPNKDHPSDEPESMTIAITVPPGLDEISNGRLVDKTTGEDGWTRYKWAVSYPINNYCVTFNIGKYEHFSDVYTAADGEELTLDYYVMPENLEKAKEHFEQTKSMLKIFEKYFGKYPFYRDGFKLIECPHNGMEHQSAIAYGNGYQGGYKGRASSEVGRKFDFIIVHEAAHEWWGNNVSMSDNADMWIHESFGAYAESLFVEDMYGHDQAIEYINGKKSNVRNSDPIIGEYNTNRSGAGDMYDKGQLVLNTLRSVIDNDPLWFEILKGIQTEFRLTNVHADDITGYIEQKTGKELDYFFDQYMRHSDLPRLQLELNETDSGLRVRYRWQADVEEFQMPIKVTTAKDTWGWIEPTSEWKSLTVEGIGKDDFKVAEELFYIAVERK